MNNKTVSIIGLGYIGLPTAALLASRGYTVKGVDVDEEVISTINKGNVHIVEPELDMFVKSAVASGLLVASKKPQSADIYMICVPTPFHSSDGEYPKPNIDFVIESAKNIAPLVKNDDLIILESTSPVGTTEKVLSTIKQLNKDLDNIYIAYCPERVLPGKIMTELIENDRIVGGTSSNSTKEAADFYRSFVTGNVYETDSKTAEMCKLTENSYRDINIAFANELSMLCDKENIDVWNLISLANKHPRVNILQPGAGVGGHCIAVDPWFIISRDPTNSKLIKTAREVNNYKSQWVLNKIKTQILNYEEKFKRKPKVACFGLAFKANIDDLRESPALEIATNLISEEYDIVVVEPNVKQHSLFNIVSIDQAFSNSDIFIILVKHKEFIETNVKKTLSSLNVLDFCGALN